MQARLNPFAAAPKTMQPFMAFSTEIAPALIDPVIAELVKIRVSQINHCAFCLHMHSREALAAGETELRITMLATWRESPLYSDRERAALDWAEALTRLPNGLAPDAVWDEVKAHFTPEEQVKLTMTIALINAWNRFGAGFQQVHAIPKPAAAAA